MLAVQKNTGEENEKNSSPNPSFVKVSMDGAPYLRKVDLKIYKSYEELSDSLGNMFSSFTIGNKTQNCHDPVPFFFSSKKKNPYNIV